MAECSAEYFGFWNDGERTHYAGQAVPYHLTIELTGRYTGSCIYCYSSSQEATGQVMPTEKVYELIDSVPRLGGKGLVWHGGDPLLHPHWYDFARYAREKGLRNVCLMPNPMSITKQAARQLCQIELDSLVMHIDTLNPQVYAQLHTRPQTLEAKIRVYRNLLEAGFPPERVVGVATFTRPLIGVIEETIDWFIDEMKAGMFIPCAFRTEGFGGSERYRYPESSSGQALESTLSEYRQVFEYRARKLGDERLLRFGSADGKHVCKNYFLVKDDGDVVPCTFMQDHVLGNVHQEDVVAIFERHREVLLFDFEVQGYCGQECENREICFGCRANAYHFLGDMRASDPKCWHNPANRDEPLLPKSCRGS